jgi:MOSC domain-containing protein
VRALAITPVKGNRLLAVQRVSLGRNGVRENRRFYWIDDHDRMVNAKVVGELQPVVAEYSDADRRLSLSFPDGTVVAGTVADGSPVTVRFFSRVREDRLVSGPWSEAMSAFAGRSLRLVEAVAEAGAVDRGASGAASLVSRASLEQLSSVAGADSIDPRRFRMLIEIDGVPAHAEDEWVGGSVRVGEAVLRFEGHVGRCLITSRDPDTGKVDLPTLDLLASYRKELPTTEPLPFGIYGRVVTPGTIAVGDTVSVQDAG